MRSPESLLNDRFKIIAAGNLPAPGKCSCCGSVERPVVDFGLDVDFYGAVLLCVTCVGNATQVVSETAELENGTLAASPTLPYGVIDEYLRSAVDATNRLISILPPSYFDDLDIIPTDDEESAEPVGDTTTGNDSNESDASGPVQQVTKPFIF